MSWSLCRRRRMSVPRSSYPARVLDSVSSTATAAPSSLSLLFRHANLVPSFRRLILFGAMFVDHFSERRRTGVLMSFRTAIFVSWGRIPFDRFLILLLFFISFFFLFRCRNISLSGHRFSSYKRTSRSLSERFSRGNPCIHSKAIFNVFPIFLTYVCYTISLVMQAGLRAQAIFSRQLFILCDQTGLFGSPKSLQNTLFCHPSTLHK